MEIRAARQSDLTAVAGIYAHYVAESHATFDTTVPGPERWTTWLAAAGPGHRRLVAVHDGEVLGYAYSSTYRSRAAYDATREVSVYVAPGARGRGVGRTLYAELLALLEADGIHTVLAAVALPNGASATLHRALGFEPVGVMREVGRKLDRWVDVEWWQRAL